MANSILHRADTRGKADHGWLKSYHTFSFAGYHNPERTHFGALRVLNDDTVEAGMGFGTHPHDNMEIISIPLEGDLEHRDSMGNRAVIKNGDVQVMSAGTGITHSEYNHSPGKPVKFLQIWVFPDKRNVTPRYGQVSLKPQDRHNQLQLIVSPDAGQTATWINQQAWFSLGMFDKGLSREYTLKGANHGVYIFVLRGQLRVNGETLNSRDGMGLWELERISLTAGEETEFLLMEVPMKI